MNIAKIPQHIGIIMDGNRRWAKFNKKRLLAGHNFAANFTLERIVEHAARRGVKYITLWAFSTENWQRDKREVVGLLNILRRGLKEKIPVFIKKGVKLLVIGDLTKFPDDLQKKIAQAVEKTREGKKITAIIALNYGGRDEIIRAIKEASSKKQEVSEKNFHNFLDTKGVPDPDLLIRTGGEKRLSGFLPWQSVYAELYFTDVLWPDFSEKDLDEAIADFQHRARRFGK